MFKVGDRVVYTRVDGAYKRKYEGFIGTVLDFVGGGMKLYKIRFDAECGLPYPIYYTKNIKRIERKVFSDEEMERIFV